MEKLELRGMPAFVKNIVTRLQNAGFEACPVGGCVRDTLLSKTPGDWDIATSALPQEVEKALLGVQMIETGLSHGTVTAISGKTAVEITTYRVDGGYTDHRRPDHVSFTPSLREDLARRDFTVNALAFCNGEVVDYFGGISDLTAGILRCVGKPDRRFQEDALRILRALRFSSCLGFVIEPQTETALFRNRHLLSNISAERTAAELKKLLCGKNAEAVLLRYHKILAVCIPEITPCVGFLQKSPYHTLDVWGHIVRSVSCVEPTPVLRLTMLLHDIGKPQCFTTDQTGQGHFYGHQKKSSGLAQTILMRLKLDKKTITTVTTLVRYHDLSITAEEKLVKRWMNRLGEENFRLLLAVNRADTLAHAPHVIAPRLESIQKEQALMEQILAQKACFSLRDLAVNGSDLLALGFPSGPQTGRALQLLLEKVLDGECPNQQEPLLALARAFLKKNQSKGE